MRHFLQEMDARVAPSSDPRQQADDTARLLAELLRHPDALPSACMRPASEHYARYRVRRDPQDRYCVVAMVWSPGQSAGLHDHDGTWCAEGVFRGQLRLTRYERLDAGAEVARFGPGDVAEAGAGVVDVLIPPDEYHTTENVYDETAVSIHVYGHELLKVRRFKALDDGGGHAAVEVPLKYNG